MTSKWLDYQMCGNTRPSVMWDHLTALQPATVKEVQTVQFFNCPELPPKIYLEQFSKTLKAAKHTATRHNTASAR